MKKVLSIVLALAMVLCMIPMMAAETTTTNSTVTYEKNPYTIYVFNANNFNFGKEIGKTSKPGNSVEAKYEYDADEAVETGKWTEDKVMGLVVVNGFQFTWADVAAKKVTVEINGKKLDPSVNADYYSVVGAGSWPGWTNYVIFPAELTEAGYTENYLVKATWENGTTDYTELARFDVKFTNTKKADKSAKTAYVTNIAKTSATKFNDDNTNTYKDVNVNVYIVGSKIYAEFANEKAQPFAMDVTFADENKAPFSGITYVYQPMKKVNNVDTEVDAIQLVPSSQKKFEGETVFAEKLSKSVGQFIVDPGTAPYETDFSGIQFKLETEAANYKTEKKYDLVVRTGIHEADPKGIYLDKSEVTIAVGEEYVPVIKAADNGRNLVPTVIYVEKTDVIDTVDGETKIIGTKPGVAYIKAGYSNSWKVLDKKYEAELKYHGWYPYGAPYADLKVTETEVDKGFAYITSTQKVTVTLPGESIPTQTVDYVVTCRNLNVRKGAGTSFGKAGMVHRGDVLKVVEIANGWAKLADGTYVCAKYITK